MASPSTSKEEDRVQTEKRYEPHLTSAVMMVRPDTFEYNPETAVTNSFMSAVSLDADEVHRRVMSEWEGAVATIESHGMTVIAMPSPIGEHVPDAVFPNNWVTHHADGTLVLYPMKAASRQKERQPIELVWQMVTRGIPVTRVVNLTNFEFEGKALEGTGSLILDRTNHVAYCIESPRADKEPFDAFNAAMGYRGVFFHAVDRHGAPIYHTNVMMSVGEQFAVVCLDSISDPSERDFVIAHLENTQKHIIPITMEQMESFCGNILQVRNADGEALIIMSKTAEDHFTKEQIEMLTEFGKIVSVEIPLIEEIGGGSARCLLAEMIPAT